MRFIDLFAGIGGFRLGLESINRSKNRRSKGNTKELSGDREGLVSEKGKTTAGTPRRVNEQSHQNTNEGAFTCIWSNEWDKYAQQVYEGHYGECDGRNIREVPTKEIPDHDLLCAGFPCQSFSIAGQRKGFRDTRGTLFFEICRILKDKRPSYLLLENVKGLLSHQDGWTFATMLLSLDELGYDVEWQVLNSKHFGVPQNRERVFIVGHLRGEGRPEVFPIEEIIQSVNAKGNVRNISGTISTKNQSGQAQWDASTTLIQESIVRRVCGLYDRKQKTHQAGSIYDTKGIAPILDTAQGGNREPLIFDHTKIRRLTPTECERLQGFPDNWTEGVSDTQRYKMLGNAVTVNVIQVIGKRLICKT